MTEVNKQKITLAPEALVRVTNGKTYVRINNPTDEVFHMRQQDHHINVKPIQHFEERINIGHRRNTRDNKIDTKINDIINKNNFNIEEESTLKILLNKFKDIFYVENEPLTFTHRINP